MRPFSFMILASILLASCAGTTTVRNIPEEPAAELQAAPINGAELYKAVVDGNLSELSRLVESGADLNWQTDNEGRTALMAALMTQNTDAAGLLIAAGTDVNIQDSWGISALMIAAAEQQTDIAKLLLEAGARVNQQDNVAHTGHSALMYAVDSGNLDSISLLLAAGADVNLQNCPASRRNKKDANNVSALMLAMTAGQPEIIERLVAAGADVNIEFIKASVRGDMDLLKMSLQLGADVNVKTEYGGSALGNTAYYGYTKIMELLLSLGAENLESALNMAATTGQTLAGYILIQAGADVDAFFATGETALKIAASQPWGGDEVKAGRTALIKYLLEAGANPDIQDKGGQTALISAALADNEIAVEWLLAAGANPNLQSLSGATALGEACNGGTADSIVSLLLAAGADVNLADNEGKTPLKHEREARFSRDYVVELLLAAGAEE